MGKKNIEESETLFPNLSFYNRAISYPYFAPDYSFSFYKGKFVKEICFDLDNTLVTYPKISNDYRTVEPIEQTINFLKYLKIFFQPYFLGAPPDFH